MDTSVPILSVKPDQYNQGRPIGSFFVMTFVWRTALPTGTVPMIGHGPTYGWVNSERASQMDIFSQIKKHYEI